MDYTADDIATWDVWGEQVILYSDSEKREELDRLDIDALVNAWIKTMSSRGYL